MKKLIVIMLTALILVSCESDEHSEATALLEHAEKLNDKSDGDITQKAVPDKNEKLKAIHFKSNSSMAFLELKSWLRNQDYLENLESSLKRQTTTGGAELASQKYQEGKKETDESEAKYNAALQKIVESSTDLETLKQVQHYLRQFRVQDARFQAEIAKAKAAKAITGEANPQLVEEREAAYKEFRELTLEEWMVDVKW